MTKDPELHTRPTSCDHCGTVERALMIWGQQIEQTCPCWCHVRTIELRQAAFKKKRKKG